MADALAKGKKPAPGATGPKGGEDAFVAGIHRLLEWMGRNLRLLLLGAAGAVLVALGLMYYVNFKATVREQAATDLARLRLSSASPEQLIPDVESFIGRYDGTASADEARVLLGHLYLDSGRGADALAVLRAVGAPADHPTGFAARSLLALAQEQSGDVRAAESTWQSLGRDARFGFQRREARANVARLYAQQGRVAEAIAIYEEIAREAEEDDDPSAAGVYRIRLGELRGEGGPGTG